MACGRGPVLPLLPGGGGGGGEVLLTLLFLLVRVVRAGPGPALLVVVVEVGPPAPVLGGRDLDLDLLVG